MLRALLVACVAVAAGGAAGGDATVSGVYLWRMRKAGSGSLQLLTEHYARAGHYFVVPNARTTMKAMDGDCATGPWRERPGLVTLTHARDPIEWQTTLYYYAGAGSKLVAPDRGATLVAADQDERLWAAWMAEGHRSRRPAGCRPGAAPGYSPGKRLHNGFGKYRPNFFTRSLVSSCGCGGARDPHGVPLGYSCRADIYDRPLGPDDLARAKRVLAAFDVVIPVGAAVMERRKPEIDAYLHAKLGASTGKTVSLPWAHRNSSAHADLSVPACVRAALEEQNAFDVLLWHWIQERLEASLDAFSRGRAAAAGTNHRAARMI